MTNGSNKGLTVLATIAMAMPFLMGMRGCGDDVPLGQEECAVDGACGAASLAPVIMCWDGTMGGNTGVCLAGADGACHWEQRDCPPRPGDCSDAECGAPPMTPLPTRCERGPADACHWVIIDPEACASSDCGPPPGTPTWTCEDGSIGGFTGRCRGQDGACAWEIVECPMTGDCTLEECGPQPDSAACTCADGSLGCNTGHCLRNAMGTCGWEWRECPGTTVPCGGLTPEPVDCGTNAFCAYRAEDICGAADAPGACQRRPDPSECEPLDSPPVCGCDGVSYTNECFAWAAGTSAASSGACAGTTADCDLRDVSCDARPPTCPAGQAATQSGACYGPCVPTDRCARIACAAAADCPGGWSCAMGSCVAP